MWDASSIDLYCLPSPRVYPGSVVPHPLVSIVRPSQRPQEVTRVDGTANPTNRLKTQPSTWAERPEMGASAPPARGGALRASWSALILEEQLAKFVLVRRHGDGRGFGLLSPYRARVPLKREGGRVDRYILKLGRGLRGHRPPHPHWIGSQPVERVFSPRTQLENFYNKTPSRREGQARRGCHERVARGRSARLPCRPLR